MLGNDAVLGCGSIGSEQEGDGFWNLQRQSAEVCEELWQRSFFLLKEAIYLVEEILGRTPREFFACRWAEDEQAINGFRS